HRQVAGVDDRRDATTPLDPRAAARAGQPTPLGTRSDLTHHAPLPRRAGRRGICAGGPTPRSNGPGGVDVPMSFEVGVVAHFSAEHHLVGDFGPASAPHSHDYRVDVSVTGESVRGDGTLFDITKLQNALTAVITD